MIQGYRITLAREGKPPMVYHGICYGDGVTAESRVDDELSLRKRVNVRLKAAIEEYGRYAFDWEVTRDFNSLYEAIQDEAARIERDKSWHPDFGYNVERIDKKRLARAQAEYVPPADMESLLDAALAEFTKHCAEWEPFATEHNEAVLRSTAKRLNCSVDCAFSESLASGAIAVAIA